MPPSKDRIEQLYKKRQIIVRKLVSKFHSLYGGDWEELHAEANYHFVKAVHKWKPKQGPLNRYMSSVVWGGLLELRRVKATRTVKKPHITLETDIPYQQSKFIELLDELTTDAVTIVKLLLRPNLDLHFLITTREGARVVHRALHEYFSDWSTDRVYNAMHDLEEILKPQFVKQPSLDEFISRSLK